MAGIVTERALVRAGGKTYELHVPVWNGIDCPGLINIFSENKLERQIRGARKTGAGKMFIESGFFGESVRFLAAVKSRNCIFRGGFAKCGPERLHC